MKQKTAIIIGAGPAGLTAAHELASKSDIRPIVFEGTSDIGGISKTVNYKGNRIDIGGHRFFSKSDKVMQWWREMMPVQGSLSRDDVLLGLDERKIFLEKDGPDPEKDDRVMLVRDRLSRIYYLRKFFDYPISLNFGTISNLGSERLFRIGMSYMMTQILPLRKEKNLEDFFINRFGKELYRTFFRDYTEKVWGVPCTAIKPEWGAQRVKGLSLLKSVMHAAKKIASSDVSLGQKETETTLIERFLYPKFGPGQMWETAAQSIMEKGGRIFLNHEIVGINANGEKITGVTLKTAGGDSLTARGDYFFSSMPVRDLIRSLDTKIPKMVRNVAEGLVYRDFLVVGLLLKKLKIRNETKKATINDVIPDNWIYVQENDVKVGRIQIFNNWSPYLVADSDNIWLGLEYFCNEGDEIWNRPDRDMAALAAEELARLGIAGTEDVIDSTVIRMPKAYPAYFGRYDDFDAIREFTDRYENLFLIGRNGMHRYNNQDHSMLTAITAVENVMGGLKEKDNIWQVNTEQEYHESK